MNLHAEIMNIHCQKVPPFSFASGDTGQLQLKAYKEGHRDARHAAAELAIKADQLAEAVKNVMEWRIDTPTRGDLLDCDKSREALKALAEALKHFDA